MGVFTGKQSCLYTQAVYTKMRMCAGNKSKLNPENSLNSLLTITRIDKLSVNNSFG